jgi:hypothetical protein
VQTIPAYEGVEIQLHSFLNLVLRGGEWSLSFPSGFSIEENTPIAQ